MTSTYILVDARAGDEATTVTLTGVVALCDWVEANVAPDSDDEVFARLVTVHEVNPDGSLTLRPTLPSFDFDLGLAPELEVPEAMTVGALLDALAKYPREMNVLVNTGTSCFELTDRVDGPTKANGKWSFDVDFSLPTLNVGTVLWSPDTN